MSGPRDRTGGATVQATGQGGRDKWVVKEKQRTVWEDQLRDDTIGGRGGVTNAAAGRAAGGAGRGDER